MTDSNFLRDQEKSKWSNYYSGLDSLMQPSEYLLKLLLGKYSKKVNFLDNKNTWRDAFLDKTCLDLSCGDGRNIPLLKKLNFQIFATEISEEICERIYQNLTRENIKINRSNLNVGFNNFIPHKSSFFDFVISWNAIYYLDNENHDIYENFKEICRVLKKDGFLICSIPGKECYSFIGAEKVGNNQLKIKPQVNKDWGGGIQKDTIYYQFNSKESLNDMLKKDFKNIQISELFWDGFGVPLNYYLFIAQKR